MNKLYLFGCSHSEVTRPITDEEFWGTLLAKKLNLQLYKVGSPGCSVNQIFFDLETTLMFYPPDESDVVIWNTSYMLRKMAKGILIKYKDEIKDGVLKDFWKPDIVCAFHWFTHTKMGYELLRNRKIETYQWLLDGERELIDLTKLARDTYKNFADVVGMSHDDTIRNFTVPEQRIFEFSQNNHPRASDLARGNENGETNMEEIVKWENLIRVPDNFNCWNDLILKNRISQKDGHMNKEGNHVFADIMYTQINEYRNEK